MKTKKNILFYLICLYIILMPLIPGNMNLKGIRISGDIILGIIIFTYILFLLISRDLWNEFYYGVIDFFTNYQSIFMFAVFILMLISIIYASDKKIALSETIRFLTYIIYYFIIKYEFYEKKYIKGFINVYIFVVFILCIMGLVQAFTGIGLNSKFVGLSYAKYKIAVTLDNPNSYASFMILPFFPILMLGLNEKNIRRKILLLTFSLCVLVNMMLTFSRNVLVGFTIGFIVLGFVYNWKYIYIFLGFIGTFSLFTSVRIRIMDLLSSSQNNSRLNLWKIGIKMIKDHPIFGVGNGNYSSLYDLYVQKYPQYSQTGYTHYASHNSFLKVMSEIGIAGIVCFISWIISIIIGLIRLSKCENGYFKYFFTGVLSSVVAFNAMSFFDNIYFLPKNTSSFILLISIAEAYRYGIKDKKIL